MRPKRFDFDVDAVDPDGLADNNASSGSTLTLDGDLTSGGTYTSVDGFGHRLSIIDTSTQDQSDSVFTVVGTDADGRAQTEAITGPESTATVESTKYFKTVTSVAIAGGDASDTVDMGTVDEFASKTIPLDHYARVAPTLQVEVTGTIDFDVQVTVQSPFDVGVAAPFDFDDQEDLAFVNDGNFGAKTAALVDTLAKTGMRAMRVVSNSFTAGAELQVYLTQPRNY